MYCEVTGLTWPTGFCDAGYLCLSAAEISAPEDGYNEPCPVGHYCEEGEIFLPSLNEKFESMCKLRGWDEAGGW